MASIDKVVEKMKNQPNGIRMAEADRVLKYYGYRLDRQRGSHCHYIDKFGNVITVVEEQPTIKSVYVKDILSRIGK